MEAVSPGGMTQIGARELLDEMDEGAKEEGKRLVLSPPPAPPGGGGLWEGGRRAALEGEEVAIQTTRSGSPTSGRRRGSSGGGLSVFRNTWQGACLAGSREGLVGSRPPGGMLISLSSRCASGRRSLAMRLAGVCHVLSVVRRVLFGACLLSAYRLLPVACCPGRLCSLVVLTAWFSWLAFVFGMAWELARGLPPPGCGGGKAKTMWPLGSCMVGCRGLRTPISARAPKGQVSLRPPAWEPCASGTRAAGLMSGRVGSRGRNRGRQQGGVVPGRPGSASPTARAISAQHPSPTARWSAHAQQSAVRSRRGGLGCRDVAVVRAVPPGRRAHPHSSTNRQELGHLRFQALGSLQFSNCAQGFALVAVACNTRGCPSRLWTRAGQWRASYLNVRIRSLMPGAQCLLRWELGRGFRWKRAFLWSGRGSL